MMDTKATKVYAMVMYDGTVLRDVVNPKMRDLHDANLVITCDKSYNLDCTFPRNPPRLAVFKNRWGMHGQDLYMQEAEALLDLHVGRARPLSNWGPEDLKREADTRQVMKVVKARSNREAGCQLFT